MAVEFIKNCVTRIPFRKQMDLCSIVAYEFPKEEVLKRTSFFARISMKLLTKTSLI